MHHWELQGTTHGCMTTQSALCGRSRRYKAKGARLPRAVIGQVLHALASRSAWRQELAADLSSPWEVTPAVTQVGISQSTGRCRSSSDAQPQTRVISPGCPDLRKAKHQQTCLRSL